MKTKYLFKKGFTVIELMLAMTFLAVLMVTIAFLTIRITSIYQKGLTIRSVNQIGRSLVAEFSRAISASPYNDQLTEATDYFQDNLNGAPGDQLYGAFCTGSYSYIWNTGVAFNEEGVTPLKYQDNNVGTIDFRLLRLEDNGGFACEAIAGVSGGTVNLADTIGKPPIELLSSTNDSLMSEVDLALYDFRVFPPTVNKLTGHAFYSATFILATIRGNIDINSSGNYCQDIGETLNSDFSYCALNKFNFSMRTTGNVGDDLGDEYANRFY